MLYIPASRAGGGPECCVYQQVGPGRGQSAVYTSKSGQVGPKCCIYQHVGPGRGRGQTAVYNSKSGRMGPDCCVYQHIGPDGARLLYILANRAGWSASTQQGVNCDPSLSCYQQGFWPGMVVYFAASKASGQLLLFILLPAKPLATYCCLFCCPMATCPPHLKSRSNFPMFQKGI